MSAATLVVVSPASASCDAQCKHEKEKAKTEQKIAKWEEKRVGDPFSVNSWAQYRACDYSRAIAERETCYAGVTNGGKSGGFFEYGKVKVPLSKSIILQGGFEGEGTEIKAFPAANGYKTLDAPPMPVTGGIKLFDKATQAQANWPAAMAESWKEAIKNKEADVEATIEMAGNGCFEELGCLNTFNLLTRQGVAFKLPLKVKITAPWLEKLGSEPCYIGSDEHPIRINLTTEGAGAAYELKFNEAFSQIVLPSRLVDVGWTIEPASDPTGCSGPYGSYLIASLDHVLEGNERTGIVVLNGILHTSEAYSVAEEGVASGEL